MSPPSNNTGIVSKATEKLRYMQRTGMLYAIMACVLIGCTAKACPGCGACQWLCRGWNSLFACETVCDAKIKFVNATTGGDITGVRPGALFICEVRNHVTGVTIFSGALDVNEDGTTATFPLERCFQPCGDNLDTGEWSITVFGLDIRTDDPACGFAQCRTWTFGGGGTGIVAVGWNDGQCVPEVNVALTPGPCGPC